MLTATRRRPRTTGVDPDVLGSAPDGTTDGATPRCAAPKTDLLATEHRKERRECGRLHDADGL